ncbi:MAG: hypothetical protein ACLVIY_01530 [Anaerobutyricum soehngenii]
MSTDKKEYGISAIIPCYNVGQYVERNIKICVKSEVLRINEIITV